jgi:acyl phosphate:glycerol-3-phosphate acyltransferase
LTTEFVWIARLLALTLGYVLGAIPFGILLTRWAGAGDLRAIGSGNIGATNVLRTGRKGLAAATLLLDAAKGAAAVLLARWLWPGTEMYAAGAAMVGHCYPIWLRFRGGKGVATLMGVVLALQPILGGIYAVVWIGMLAGTRISSLAGITAAASAPVAAALAGRFDLVLLLLGLGLIVLWKHGENIDRLLSGTEPKVGGRREPPAP